MKKEELKKSAALGKLYLDDLKLELIKSDIEDTLNFLSEIKYVDESDLEKEEKTISFDSLREDISEEKSERNDILKNIPNLKNDLITVPQIIKKEK